MSIVHLVQVVAEKKKLMNEKDSLLLDLVLVSLQVLSEFQKRTNFVDDLETLEGLWPREVEALQALDTVLCKVQQVSM